MKAWWQVSEIAALNTSNGIDLGPLDSVPIGEGRSVIIGGKNIAIFRPRSGAVYATQADCPHLGGPLADGILTGDSVVCPLHEMKFDLKSGEPARNLCDRLQTYEVRVTPGNRMILEPIVGAR